MTSSNARSGEVATRSTFRKAIDLTLWEDGTKWTQDASMELLEQTVSFWLGTFWGRVEQHEGEIPTAAEVVESLINSMGTCVLATVVGARWRETWLVSIILTIIDSYRHCQELSLHAVKGGDFIETRLPKTQCDCELLFIINFIGELPEVKLLEDGVSHTNEGFTQWRWEINRPDGAKPYGIFLIVHHDVSNIDVSGLGARMVPNEAHATAPNLRRLAIVCAPCKGLRDERVDEILNRKMRAAMELTRMAAKDLDEQGRWRAHKRVRRLDNTQTGKAAGKHT